MRRRLAAVAAVVLLLLAGADYAVWRIATDLLAGHYRGWRAALAAQGWQVQSAAPVATGWPFAAGLRLDRFRLSQLDPAGLAWTARRVTFGVSALAPHRLSIEPGGEQTLAALGRTMRWRAARLQAWAPLPLDSLVVRASGLVVQLSPGTARLRRARLTLAWHAGAARAVLQAGPAMLEGRPWAFGQTIDLARLDLVAHGAWPAGDDAGAAARWRDAGGALDVSAFALRWGALDATASGRAALGPDLQPVAALTVHIVGPGAALASLAEAGAISPGTATAAAAVLDLIAQPARSVGQSGSLALPVRLEGGTVSLGQIPLARVPPIEWH